MALWSLWYFFSLTLSRADRELSEISNLIISIFFKFDFVRFEPQADFKILVFSFSSTLLLALIACALVT